MTVLDPFAVSLIGGVSIGLVAGWGTVCLLDWLREEVTGGRENREPRTVRVVTAGEERPGYGFTGEQPSRGR